MTNDPEIFRVDRVSVPPCLATVSDLSIVFRARLVNHKCFCKAMKVTATPSRGLSQ